MQKPNFIKGIQEILLSLTSEELKEVISPEILEKINSIELKTENKPDVAYLPQAKENIFERLRELGIERFNDAKETITETVNKIDFNKLSNKKPVQSSQVSKNIPSESQLKNNPFLKLQH